MLRLVIFALFLHLVTSYIPFNMAGYIPLSRTNITQLVESSKNRTFILIQDPAKASTVDSAYSTQEIILWIFVLFCICMVVNQITWVLAFKYCKTRNKEKEQEQEANGETVTNLDQD